MRRTIARCFLAALLVLPAVAEASETIYDELRAQRLDGRRVAVADLVLEQDVFKFRLVAGTLHFLAPAAERTYGAVFIGSGSFELAPATEDERRQLRLVSGDAELSSLADSFDAAVFFFTDETADLFLGAGEVGEGEPDPAAATELTRAFKKQRKDFRTNFHLRLLQDLLADAPQRPGVFFAIMNSSKLPPSLLAVDPLGAEALRVVRRLGAEESILYVSDEHRGGLWYLSHRRDEVASGRHSDCKPRRLMDARHYEIDTRIAKNKDVSGTTTIRFVPLVDGERVVPIELLFDLRLETAVLLDDPEGAGRPLQIIQEDKDDDADAALVFPEPLAAGKELRVQLTYAGDEVVYDYGHDIYAVRARSSWYPNLGTFRDLATFDMTFRVPEKKELIAVGELVETRVDEETNETITLWKSDEPLQVAGFNYGRFEKQVETDEISGVTIELYTGKDASNEENAMADALNSLRLFHTAFGPLPQKRIAVTQQLDFSFGQAWPGLVFLPYGSFVNQTLLAQAGIFSSNWTEFRDTVGPHEMAHQWWGHLLGWESYRDQWLSEGFATFSANYLLQQSRGWEAHDKIVKEQMESIIAKQGGTTYKAYEVGPISAGWRISTHKTPGAYAPLTYNKGAFVLHMLRMMLIDPRAEQPDARFLAIVRDFVDSYAGKHPSTDDFKRVVERHMVPELNATRDGKMDWFFDQWVHGMEIPFYESDLSVERAGGGQYRIRGTVKQQRVSGDFITMVPIYVDFGKGRTVLLGRLPFKGEMSQNLDRTMAMPQKPKAVLINAHYDVLHLTR